mgnify:CR=1 FL=1
MADIFWSKLSSIQREICLSITEGNFFQFKFTNCMLNHQSVTLSGVPPFIVFWYQKVEWITLNYSVVTKPMSYNSVLFPLTKMLVMVGYWIGFGYKGGWRILNDGLFMNTLTCTPLLKYGATHAILMGFCLYFYLWYITFGLNLQIFHIIWKSESLLIVFLTHHEYMDLSYIVGLLCCPEWRYQCCDSSEWPYITSQVISKRGRYIYGDCDLSIVSYQNYCCA